MLCDTAAGTLALRGTVLRCGVPVPDRGDQGLALGFLDVRSAPEPDPPAEKPGEAAGDAPEGRVLIPGGGHVDLFGPGVHMHHADLEQLQVEAERDLGVVFARDAVLTVAVAVPADGVEARLRVRVGGIESTGAGHVYRLETIDVSDRSAHARWTERVQRR